MVEILQQWNLYNHSKLKEHYNNYKLLKDVLHNLRRRSLGEHKKLRCGEFLKDASAHMTNRQTYVKQRQDAWNIFELMDLQELLLGSQLLIVEGKLSDHSCHFLFVGPPVSDSLFILKEGSHFHGIKDPITFFEKYCLFYCCC